MQGQGGSEQESGGGARIRGERSLSSSEVDVDEPVIAEQGAMVDGASNGSSKERPLQPKDSKNSKGCVGKKLRSVSFNFAETLDLELGNGDRENER